ATATFTNETASGWQQVSFATAVPISPNTTYVASYHAPNGHYSGDEGYFANNGYSTGPLHALTNGVDGPNGVFKYGTSSLFPAHPLPAPQLLRGRPFHPHRPRPHAARGHEPNARP